MAILNKFLGTSNPVDLTSEVTGTLPLANGGTNATTAQEARDNLLIGTLETIVAKTNGSGSPYSIVAADAGKIFTNEGATAEVYLNLPTSPSIGQKFTGVCVDTDNMRFVAQGSQTIRLGATVSAGAGYCQLSGIGSTVTLLYTLSNQWIALAATGTANIA